MILRTLILIIAIPLIVSTAILLYLAVADALRWKRVRPTAYYSGLDGKWHLRVVERRRWRR